MSASMRKGFRVKTTVFLVAGCFAISQNAFAAQEDCNGNFKTILTVVGTVGGAYIGSQIGDGKAGAALAGGLLGGFLGNYVGSEIDRRHCELEKIAKSNQVILKFDNVELKDSPAINAAPDIASATVNTQAASVQETTGKVDVSTWQGAEHFSSNSDALTPQAKNYFADAAKQYNAANAADAPAADAAIASQEEESKKKGAQMTATDKQKLRKKMQEELNQRPIVLVGHTDDTGNSLANQKLSERRAQVVAKLFKAQGIPASRIYFRGAGDADPVADNRTEAGRAANRRVEVIELESREKLDTFIALKKSNADYLQAKGESVVGEASQSKPETSPVASVTDSLDKSKRTKVAKASSAHTSHASATETVAAQDNVVTKSDAPNENKSAVERASVASSVSTPTSWVDFGGDPASSKIAPEVEKSMGKALQPEKSVVASIANIANFFVKEAQASGEKIYNLPCTADAPRYGGEYLSLDTGKPVAKVKTAAYAPGLYQTSWVGVVNGHYLGLTPVGVLRANFQPASQPGLLVYANNATPGNSAKPTLKVPMQVNVYPGEDGILYRMYATGKTNLVCADVVLPHRPPFVSTAGKLYYKHSGQIYENDYKPEMLVLGKAN